MDSSHGPEVSRHAIYVAPDSDPITVLVVSNEIASPLRGPQDAEGNFGSFARRLAQSVAPHGIGVYAHERLGSADEQYRSATADHLTPANRPETMRRQAVHITKHLIDAFPAMQKIGLVGHSAGAVESIGLARALKNTLSGVAISHLIAFDPPRHHHLLTTAGVARYLAYLPYEAILPKPAKSPEELAPATEGALRRLITDARYNAAVWTSGVRTELEIVARCMPETAIHVIAARHSPNNIAHLRGPKHYVSYINHLRDQISTAAPCNAEVYDGPHAGGSRNAVIMKALGRAGIVTH